MPGTRRATGCSASGRWRWRPDLPYAEDEPLVALDRLRLVDGLPAAIHRSVLSAALVEEIGLTESRSRPNRPSRSTASSSRPASSSSAASSGCRRGRRRLDERRLLELERDAVVMAVHRRSFASDGSLLDVVDAIYDARRYSYEARLLRRAELDGSAAFNGNRETSHAAEFRRSRGLSALALGLGATFGAAHAAEKPVALIIAQGGLGDQSYNDLAYSGFKKALAETKLEGKPVESKDVVAQAADILRRASDAGFGLIVDLEYSHGEALAKVAAKDYPDTKFVILNQVKPGANVASVLFQEQEGSYLAGALAAMVTTDTSIKGMNGKPIIGVIGGTKSVGIDKFIVGYIQGARAVEPERRGQGRLFQQFRRPGDRPADGQGDVRGRRQHRLPGRRRHRHRRHPGGEGSRPLRHRRRHRPGRPGARQRC